MDENIQKSFDSTIKDSNLENITIDAVELTIDRLTDEGILKDIPIIGTLVSLAKLGANIHDRLFLKKIICFLNELKSLSVEDRKKMIERIDSSKEYRIKVGEKLLYIIDACGDYENSELVAGLFKAFVEEKISYSDYLQSSDIVTKISPRDFKWFLKNGQRRYMKAEDVGGLFGSGLFELFVDPIDVRVEDETDRKTLMEGGHKYKTNIDGGDMRVSLTRAAEVILEVFCVDYKKPKVIKL